MEELISEIRRLIQPLFDEEYFHLVDIVIHGTPGNQVLKIYADTETGITLEELTRLTREINDILDVHDVIPGRYRMEVSSPGVNRFLQYTWEFRKNLGRELRVIYQPGEEEREEVRGILKSVTEDEIVIQQKKQEINIPRSTILKARVQLKW
ncbi:MAG: ribosome maturation factor RimP [Calditrichaeota bacterium]|nr:MAG: ribosome maturation factor RimP [Calditrichota bacterium]